MSNHNLTWRTLRLNHGLRWQQARPTLGELKTAADNWLYGITVAAVLLVAYGIVGRIDYELERAQAAETRAELNRAALLACLNGNATGHYYEDAHGNRTHIVCRGA